MITRGGQNNHSRKYDGKLELSKWTLKGTVPQRVAILGTGSPEGPFFWLCRSLLGPYLYFKVPIFNVSAKFTRRMSIQSACTQQWVNLICAVLNHNLLLKMVSIFIGTVSVLHCWQFFVFYSAYALNFINPSFGVPILAAEGPYWVPTSWKVGSLFSCEYIYLSSPLWLLFDFSFLCAVIFKSGCTYKMLVINSSV